MEDQDGLQEDIRDNTPQTKETKKKGKTDKKTSSRQKDNNDGQ